MGLSYFCCRNNVFDYYNLRVRGIIFIFWIIPNSEKQFAQGFSIKGFFKNFLTSKFPFQAQHCFALWDVCLGLVSSKFFLNHIWDFILTFFSGANGVRWLSLHPGHVFLFLTSGRCPQSIFNKHLQWDKKVLKFFTVCVCVCARSHKCVVFKAVIAFLLWISRFSVFSPVPNLRLISLFTTKMVYNENHHIHIIHRTASKCVALFSYTPWSQRLSKGRVSS